MNGNLLSSDDLLDFMKEVWSFNRSITGEGVRQTLQVAKQLIPELEIKEVPTGLKFWDWTVPPEWRFKSAQIFNAQREVVLDAKNSNLHVVSYSHPINTTLSLDELQKKLFSLPDLPDAIPYRTSYYKKDWGFCVSHNQFKKFESDKKLRTFVATKLNEGKVVGWYQGHIEFGSRALGNRSILANPTFPDMKDKINRVIKKREGFRPFAPMVIKEKQHEFFDMVDDIPYMNQVVKVKEEYRDKLPAVTHVDGSARVQTVYSHTQIHDLLKEFEKISGYPILLNTSFNVKDKTMVLTPKDAVDTYFDTEMDILVMGNYVMFKS